MFGSDMSLHRCVLSDVLCRGPYVPCNNSVTCSLQVFPVTLRFACQPLESPRFKIVDFIHPLNRISRDKLGPKQEMRGE